jgi:hypothetical protein
MTGFVVHNDSWSFTEENRKNPVQVGIATGPQYRYSGRVIPMTSLDAQTLLIGGFDLNDPAVASKYSKGELDGFAQALTFIFLLQEYAELGSNCHHNFQRNGRYHPVGMTASILIRNAQLF